MTPVKENPLREQGAYTTNHTRESTLPRGDGQWGISGIDVVLSRLEAVRRSGEGRWSARCPAHEDRGPSLSIRELSDGRLILLHCFAGCDVAAVLSALSLDMAALFPAREIQHGKPERRPFPAVDILKAIAFEATLVGVAASTLLAGEPFDGVDRERLSLAVGRIHAALNAGGLRHG